MGQQLKVLRAQVVDPRRGGNVIAATDAYLLRSTGCGGLWRGSARARVIQLEGKRALPADDVLRGYPALASAISRPAQRLLADYYFCQDNRLP